MKFRTHFNYDDTDLYETCIGDSMAEPDQSLSVKDIIRQFANGSMSPADFATRDDYYNDDIDHPDPRIIDLTDLDDIKNDVENTLNKVENERDTYHINNTSEHDDNEACEI